MLVLLAVSTKHGPKSPLSRLLAKAEFGELVALHLHLIGRVRDRDLLDRVGFWLRTGRILLSHRRRLNIHRIGLLGYLDMRRDIHIPIALNLRIVDLTPVGESFRGPLHWNALRTSGHDLSNSRRPFLALARRARTPERRQTSVGFGFRIISRASSSRRARALSASLHR